MRVQLLGPVEVFGSEGSLPLGGPKQRAVLAVLAMEPGRPVSMDRLVDAVWGDEVPQRANRSISTFISNLRNVLSDVVARESSGYVARLERSQVDACLFEDAVTRARDGSDTDPTVVEELREALGLWRGEPFEGVDGHWVLAPLISRLQELRLHAQELVLEAELLSGRVAETLTELEALVDQYPEREHLRALLMRALYKAGRQTDALATFRQFQQHLGDHYGLDPSPELQDLELRILQQDPTLAVDQRDAPVAASMLPARYASFLGRHQELAEVAERIKGHRLVCLVGPGGIGKSSLAAEALRSCQEELEASIVRVTVESSTGEDLAWMVATAMGLQPQTDPEQVIIGYARDRPHVLVFDGCEPVINHAAHLADLLLTSCPTLRIVATSRQSLSLPGESVVRVDPLQSDDAYTLFCQRAGLDDTLDDIASDRIHQTCEALDGMPLAIELAAARTRAIPLDTLVTRLDDQIQLLHQPQTGAARHSSLQAAMEWSYQLLDSDHQQALRYLSVFRHPFDLTAATALLDHPHPADLVAHLVDMSLLQPPDPHGSYRMLEPIRQYAHHRLQQHGEEDTARSRHAVFFAEHSAEVWIELWSPRTLEATAWIVRNHFEIESAIEWCLETDQPDTAIEIIANLGLQIAYSGYSALILPLATTAVEHPAATPSPQLAQAMANTTYFLMWTQDSDKASHLIGRAEALARQLDDSATLGRVLCRKGSLYSDSIGTTLERRRMLLEGIDLLQDADAPEWGDWYYNLIDGYYLAVGDLTGAETHLERFLEWQEATFGDTDGTPERHLASLYALKGDLEAAVTLSRQAASKLEERQELARVRHMWMSHAYYLSRTGRIREALAVMRHIDKLGATIGADPHDVLSFRISLAGMHGDDDFVLEAAKQWFQGMATSGMHPLGRFTSAHLLRGSFDWPPPFLTVLIALTTAWMRTGSVDAACRFATAAPHLMAQTNYHHWEQIGETARWQALQRQCPDQQPDEDMTLEEAFAEAARLVGVDISEFPPVTSSATSR